MRIVLSILLLVSAEASPAATIFVTNYAAIGDCRSITVSLTTNSSVMVTTNTFTAADVGKVVQLYGGGYYAGLSNGPVFHGNYQGTVTNHQDLVASIVSIANGTNVTLSAACGVTATGILCTYGTNNVPSFQACINAAQSNDVIRVTTGNFLLMPSSALDTNFVQSDYYNSTPAIEFYKGGISFLGDGTNLSVLTGNGAWHQKGLDSAYRGFMFKLSGPVTNNGPLIFKDLQFNGAATSSSRTYRSYPGIPTDGSGWDPTHHAIQDISGPSAPHNYINITNCLFVHFHGETIQGIVNSTNPYADVGHCTFIDGYSTVFNYYVSHDYHDIVVSDYLEVEEGGQGYGSAPSYFRNSTFSSIIGGVAIGIGGADTNTFIPPYNILSNNFTSSSLSTAPGANINVIGNTFDGANTAFSVGTAGQQSTMWNSNIVFAWNLVTNAQTGLKLLSAGDGRTDGLRIFSNYFSTARAIVESAAGSYSTNVVLTNNTYALGAYSVAPVWSQNAAGQYSYDGDISSHTFFVTGTAAAGNFSLNYYNGAWQSLQTVGGSTVFILDDTQPSKVPLNARFYVYNLSGTTAKVVTGTINPSTNSVPDGVALQFLWDNVSTWSTNAPTPPPIGGGSGGTLTVLEKLHIGP